MEVGREPFRWRTVPYTETSRFNPPESDGTVMKFRFFILPPLQKVDACSNGKASRAMELFYVPYEQYREDSHQHFGPESFREATWIARCASAGSLRCPENHRRPDCTSDGTYNRSSSFAAAVPGECAANVWPGSGVASDCRGRISASRWRDPDHR